MVNNSTFPINLISILNDDILAILKHFLIIIIIPLIYIYSLLESTCSFYSKKHSTRFQTKYRNESESIRKLIPSGSSYSREYKVWKLSTEIVREEWQDGVWLSYCFSFIWNHSIWESLSPSECKCVNKTSSC